MSAAIELTESPPVHTHINMRVLESYLIRSLSRQGCKASACRESRDLAERVKDRDDEMSEPSRLPATLFFKRRSEQSPVKGKRRSGASTSVGGWEEEGEEKFVTFVLLR